MSLAGPAVSRPGARARGQLPYNGLALDRAASRRGDPSWIEQVGGRAETRTILFWQDRCLVSGREQLPVQIMAGDAAGVLAAAEACVFLGLDGEAGVFAADLSGLDQDEAARLGHASGTADLRSLVGRVSAEQAAALGYARGILRWNREQRFCGACGAPAAPELGGTARRCGGADCGRLLFPRIEPAVIVLVQGPGPEPACLLARHAGAAAGAFSLVAGFAEVGEGLEDAVRRELAEETGVLAGEVSYQGSQAWPFPSGLMIGFRARALSPAICVDAAEVAEARWFTPAEVSALTAQRPGRGDSIDGFLISAWLAEQGAT